MKIRLLTLGLLALVAGCKKDAPAAAEGEPVRVAAASDLGPVLEELVPAFQKATGLKVLVSIGATGQFAKQLEQGAPFDLFAAADKSFVTTVTAKGLCDPASMAEYARGSVVAWTKEGIAAPTRLEDLADPRFVHIGIANPDHAPYGRAAKQALEKAEVWEKIKDRVVLAENVRGAFQFVQTGNVEVALISKSQATPDGKHGVLAIDPALHAPLEQTLAVCLKGKNTAGGRQVAAMLLGPEGRAALTRHGFSFSVPDAGAAP